ncbi:hypothetical protein Hanom_Chr00s001040g01672801 [Helianthus anomalus]
MQLLFVHFNFGFLQALSFKFKNYTLRPLCLQPITCGVLYVCNL